MDDANKNDPQQPAVGGVLHDSHADVHHRSAAALDASPGALARGKTSRVAFLALLVSAPWIDGCASPAEGGPERPVIEDSMDDAPRSTDDDEDQAMDGSRARDAGVGRLSDAAGDEEERPAASRSDGGSRGAAGASQGSAADGAASDMRDAAAAADADDAAVRSDASGHVSPDAGAPETCTLPRTFRWTGAGPLAQPKNGWLSMKDVTHVFHDGRHILYFTTFQTGWGSGMMTFEDWADAATAPQLRTSFGVAPTLFYFSPKRVWVIAYQWGAHKFSYRTSSDPKSPNGWSEERSLYRTALPAGGTGPIDQTVICDDARCFLYYAGDNGHIYKSSLPIDSFPGEFPAATDSGIVGTVQNLFEGVQVYKLKGGDEYLMIVEAQGSARYFRAFTANDLDGPWTLLTNEFAVKKNLTLTPDWTNDISHGDLVRSDPDETFTVDPCNLQMVFQGRDPSVRTEYGRLPYRLGLITLER